MNHAVGLNLPTYATEHSAGMDLTAALEEAIEIGPGERMLIPHFSQTENCGSCLLLSDQKDTTNEETMEEHLRKLQQKDSAPKQLSRSSSQLPNDKSQPTKRSKGSGENIVLGVDSLCDTPLKRFWATDLPGSLFCPHRRHEANLSALHTHTRTSREQRW